jgi:AcrR family transcriptional regulator
MTVTAAPDRRTAILDAALERFGSVGYERATIAEVCRRSGASVGSVYHRFGDKRGIAEALYAECLADYHRGLVAALAPVRGAERGIRAMVRHHLGWVRDNPSRAAFLFEPQDAGVADGRRIRELNEESFAACREWLEPHWAAGRIRRMPLELLYAIVLGPSQEFARGWLRNPDPDRIAAAGRELARAAWNGVGTAREDDR